MRARHPTGGMRCARPQRTFENARASSFFPQLARAVVDATSMIVRHDWIPSECASSDYPLPGGSPAANTNDLQPPGAKTSGIADTIALGRRVLELAAQLSPPSEGNGQKPPSFRLIAKQLAVPKGASSVWRAAAIYRLAERYPELHGYQHLGVGHLAVLLCLRGPLQLALLRKAERLRWSRRKLEAKVKRILEEKAQGADALGSLLDELGAEDGAPSPVSAGAEVAALDEE